MVLKASPGVYAPIQLRGEITMASLRLQPGTRLAAIAATVVAILIGSVVVATPAVAAPQGLLTIAKIVNGEQAVELAPGDEFDYTITVGCDDNDCLDATLVDAMPAQFDGEDRKSVV